MTTYSSQVQRLVNQLNQQWRSFQDRMDKLRQPLDFARFHYYLTQEAEPVLELLKPGISWVAKGRYGPTLVSRDLPIWDVDLGWDNTTGDLPDYLPKLTSQLQIPEADCRSFRVYATFGGVRVIATEPAPDSGSLSPFEGNWFKAIGKAIYADPAYMAISTRQKCSRARLAPKTTERRWDTKPPEGDPRACRFIGWIGIPKVAGTLHDQINFHDRRTEALDSDKELF